jgi:superfamily II DNA/RNA helicase
VDSTLPHVVNFELPNIPEDYVHRIGRTEELELMEKQYLYLALTKRFFT